MSPPEAISILEKGGSILYHHPYIRFLTIKYSSRITAIPLFYPTANLTRRLELFNHPSRIHTPLETSKHRDVHLSMSKATLSAGLLGDTKIDIDAFSNAMQGLHHVSHRNKKQGRSCREAGGKSELRISS